MTAQTAPKNVTPEEPPDVEAFMAAVIAAPIEPEPADDPGQTEYAPLVPMVVPAPRQHTTIGVGALAAMDDAAFEATLAQLTRGQERLKKLHETLMVEKTDYGTVPGIPRPFLHKPGAEKLAQFYGLVVRFEADRIIGRRGIIKIGETEAEEGGWLSPPLAYHVRAYAHLGDFDGPVVAQGYGEANVWEEKHRYRNTSPACPECGHELIKRKSPPNLAGKWNCPNWGGKGGCNRVFEPNDERIKPAGKVENENPYDLANCVTPETRILTADLRWVPAGELVDGDLLVAVSEDAPDRWGRHFETAVARVAGRRVDVLFEIELADGRTVRCNGEHKWLVRTADGLKWVATETMFEGGGKRLGRPPVWRIHQLSQPWTVDESRSAGYLAGLLDADGCLSISKENHAITVSFAQQFSNGVLDAMQEGLAAHGFRYSVSAHGNLREKPVANLHVLGGLSEVMRVLGTLRPPRLMNRWVSEVSLDRRRFECGSPALVTDIRRIGEGEIVLLGTSAGTYFAEGLLAHNTLVKMAEKRAMTDVVLRATNTSGLYSQEEDSPSVRAQASGAPEDSNAEPPVEKVNVAPVERGGKEQLATSTQINEVAKISREKDLGPERIAEIIERVLGTKIAVGSGDRRTQGQALLAGMKALSADNLGRVLVTLLTGEVPEVPAGPLQAHDAVEAADQDAEAAS